MNKWLYQISMLGLLLGFVIVGIVAYWTLYPYKVLEFKEGNGIIIEQSAKPGGYINIRQNRCKYLKFQGIISRQFIDTIVYQIPQYTTDRPLGCLDQLEMVYVPKALGPGDYYISTTITYHVNPLRNVTYTVNTNKFTVLPNGR